MLLRQSTDASSSSLEPSRSGSPSHQPLSAPPPPKYDEVKSYYEKRALPPPPPKRASGISAFSKEIDDAFATPTLVTPDGSIPLVYRPSVGHRSAVGDDGEDDGVGGLDGVWRREDLKANTASTNAPQFCGATGPRKVTPTGHQSPKKLTDITGCDLAYDEGVEQQRASLLALHKNLYDGVSPLSNNGEVYELDDPSSAVSEMAVDLGVAKEFWLAQGVGYFGGSSLPHRSTALSVVPKPLRIDKNEKPSDNLNPKLGAHSRQRKSDMMARNEYDRGVSTSRSTKDLYHYAAKKLAEPDTLAEEKATREKEKLKAQAADREKKRMRAEKEQREKEREHAVQQLMKARDKRDRSHKPKQLSLLPHQPQPAQPLNGTLSGSSERARPTSWRPSTQNLASPHAANDGGGSHGFPRPLPTPPSQAPDAGLCSVFESGSDLDTPETSRSIPTSIGSSPEEAMSPTRRHHAGGILAEMFHVGKSASPTTTRPPHPRGRGTVPPRPPPAPRLAQSPSPPISSYTFPSLQSHPPSTSYSPTPKTNTTPLTSRSARSSPPRPPPPPPPQPTTSPSSSSPSSSPRPPSTTPTNTLTLTLTPTATSNTKLKPKPSLSSALLSKRALTGAAGAAADFLRESTATVGNIGRNERERRRKELLKGRIMYFTADEGGRVVVLGRERGAEVGDTAVPIRDEGIGGGDARVGG